MVIEPIAPRVVRYIKLGRGGEWEKECIRDGTIRFGTRSADADRYPLAMAHDWQAIKARFMADGIAKTSATRAMNETRHFFADDGSTLWITFHARRMLWAFLQESPPLRHPDQQGTYRVVVDRWRPTDLLGAELTMEHLAGSLTKSAAYRGTSFELNEAASEYVVRRINGDKPQAVVRALASISDLHAKALELIRLLEPRDFELLVDLVFTSSGWRRIGELGRTQDTIDMAIVLPSTGETAMIQVKSKASNDVLSDYIERLINLPYQRMFFVYHSGQVASVANDRVVLIGPERLTDLVIDAGLVRWLIDKAT